MTTCLEHPTLVTLRRVLMVMLVLGLVGTGVELLLLGTPKAGSACRWC